MSSATLASRRARYRRSAMGATDSPILCRIRSRSTPVLPGANTRTCFRVQRPPRESEVEGGGVKREHLQRRVVDPRRPGPPRDSQWTLVGQVVHGRIGQQEHHRPGHPTRDALTAREGARLRSIWGRIWGVHPITGPPATACDSTCLSTASSLQVIEALDARSLRHQATVSD
jgi:hypothetical protein